MNERIRELVDSSYISVLTTKGMEHIVDGCYIVSPDRLEEFVKSIIHECANVAMKDWYTPDGYGTVSGQTKAVEFIKEHFGVDE